MKDNFSTNSDNYALFRPTYPKEIFTFINELDIPKNKVWDCGTGTGQVASVLSEIFERVEATDISQSQLENAIQKENIFYTKEPAEKTHFLDSYFDLVVVAQAIHWFQFDLFYKEVKRVSKKHSKIFVIGYGIFETEEPLNQCLLDFYRGPIHEYWDPERKYIDQMYETIPFPFEIMEVPKFTIEVNWNFEQLLGYLNTWSAVKHYIKDKKINPVDVLKNQVEKIWKEGGEKKIFRFPIATKLGKIHS